MAHKVMKELNGLSQEELKEKVNGWRRELFGLRLSSSTTHVKDFSQFNKLRKNIARGLTMLSQEDQESAQLTTAHKE